MNVRRLLTLRHTLRGAVRGFFDARGYLEVDTPVLVSCPGIELHVDALAVEGGLFLATSPELHMKRLLAGGSGPIYQITRAFRRGELGRLHNPEFAMLEWYAPGEDAWQLMDATEALVREAAGALAAAGVPSRLGEWPLPFARLTVDEAFGTWAGWQPSLNFDEDRFFADLIDRVEPELTILGAVFLCDFPAPLASLARLSSANPRVAERMELYLDGVEICNGFSELTDPLEQAQRFEAANLERRRRGKPAYPVDRLFLEALQAGLPASAGNALGLDRLLLALTGAGSLDEVLSFTAARP